MPSFSFSRFTSMANKPPPKSITGGIDLPVYSSVTEHVLGLCQHRNTQIQTVSQRRAASTAHPCCPQNEQAAEKPSQMTELAVLAMAVNGTCTNCHWESGVFCSSKVLKRATWWVGKGKTTYNDITPRKFGSSWCSLCPDKSEHQFFNL